MGRNLPVVAILDFSKKTKFSNPYPILIFLVIDYTHTHQNQ